MMSDDTQVSTEDLVWALPERVRWVWNEGVTGLPSPEDLERVFPLWPDEEQP